VLTVSIHAHPKRFIRFFCIRNETDGAGKGFNLNLPMERGTVIKDYWSLKQLCRGK
jgi:acetoin utilization deacetylase AcuC-like enzyme